MRALPWAAVVLLLGCNGAAADHEQLGDRAYGAGRLQAALAEYQAAVRTDPRPRIWGKIGTAALAMGRYSEAADALEHLAKADPGRAAEAATGLVRTVQLALREDPPDQAGAARAFLALRMIAPGRPQGLLALRAARGGALEPPEAIRVLPLAIGAAGSPRVVDSLLVALGDAMRATTACEDAVRIFQTALRRTRDPGMRSRARDGLGACTLRLGLDALAADNAPFAETWFDLAIRTDPESRAGRQARIGFGDARLRQGDVLGAVIAFTRAMEGLDADDSLAVEASQRLSALRGDPPRPQEGLSVR